jgi:hypothetical protein
MYGVLHRHLLLHRHLYGLALDKHDGPASLPGRR